MPFPTLLGPLPESHYPLNTSSDCLGVTISPLSFNLHDFQNRVTVSLTSLSSQDTHFFFLTVYSSHFSLGGSRSFLATSRLHSHMDTNPLLSLKQSHGAVTSFQLPTPTLPLPQTHTLSLQVSEYRHSPLCPGLNFLYLLMISLFL